MKYFFLLLLFLRCAVLGAQDSSMHHFKGVFFPYPMDRGSKFSVGFTNTTLPYDITNDVHFRVPALDLHWLKRITPALAMDIRANVQVLQNLFTAGPRLAAVLGDRYSIAIGNDVGYWFGAINVAGIKTHGHGFQNLPNFSIGRRFKKKVLLTFRADAQMNFGIKSYAETTELKSNNRLLSGSSYGVILEQPFYGNKTLSLGFRAIYADFFWQTWTFYSPYDRNIFYPQITIGLNL